MILLSPALFVKIMNGGGLKKKGSAVIPADPNFLGKILGLFYPPHLFICPDNKTNAAIDVDRDFVDDAFLGDARGHHADIFGYVYNCGLCDDAGVRYNRPIPDKDDLDNIRSHNRGRADSCHM